MAIARAVVQGATVTAEVLAPSLTWPKPQPDQLRRWRRAGRSRDTEVAPDEPPDPAERERLDSDLARYDL